MCKLCRKVKQSTFYSCGHEKVRTADVPCILFWHKERKEAVFRNRYKPRSLCEKCRVSIDKVKEKIKKKTDSGKARKGDSAGAGAAAAGGGGGVFAPEHDNDGKNTGDAAAQQKNNSDANTGEAAAQEQRNGRVPNNDRAGGQPDSAGPVQGGVRANAHGSPATEDDQTPGAASANSNAADGAARGDQGGEQAERGWMDATLRSQDGRTWRARFQM